MNSVKGKIILTSILLFLIFNACDDDDGYSLSKRWETIATAYPVSGNSYYLMFDNGEKIGVAASNVTYLPKANQRIYLNFTYLSDSTNGFDHLVKVNWLAEILTKEVIDLTFENQDSIGNDPVKIHSLWIGDDYLNIYFGYNYGKQSTHYINLVNNTIPDPYPSEGGEIYLEFRHNKNDDPEWYGKNGYAAFDLRKYKEEAITKGKDSLKFVIGVLDFGEEYKTYSITYKLNNNTTDIRTSLTYESDDDATLFR